tara:strand:- start:2387 stop:2956 length:570 start_codon:yes stop_codon:yes gene_type:complete
MSNKTTNIIVFLFIIAFVSMAYHFMGMVPGIVFAVASIGGLILWRFTTYQTPIDPHKVIIPYLVTIVLFIIHVYEEYLTDFEVAVTDIFGFHVQEQVFMSIAAFLGPVLWISGAILLLKRTQFGYYFLSFFIIAMTMAELSHYIFPFMEDGTFHYVSGMYTAALPLIPALYCLYIVLREIKNEKSKTSI